MKAPEALSMAAGILEERGKSYDQDDGERSISDTVRMFQLATNITLTEEQGWIFMVCLKLARRKNAVNKTDSVLDAINYLALSAEESI